MNRFSEKNDTELCELSLLGENEAYEELVKRHESSVKKTALSVTKDEYFSNDASQEAFVSAWVKLNTLNDFECFGPWVCAIAKNRARDIMRKVYRCASTELSFNLYEYKTSDDEFENDTQLSALRSIWDKERDDELHEIVASLKETFRSVVDLHYFKGLSVEEISQKLSLPEGTVKWRLSEARKLLRKEYGLMEDKKGNRTLVQKVMEEVEKLKLWKLKDSKEGFETDYEKTLNKVEKLDASPEKAHAIADVLQMGCWWIPGQYNDEVIARIKENAEKGHNEEVMQNIISDEIWTKPNIDFADIFDNIIPYLKKHDFKKVLGFVYFIIGNFLKQEDALLYCEKALSFLEESDPYYHAALSRIEIEKYKKHEQLSENLKWYTEINQIKIINGKTYMWVQKGFEGGYGHIFLAPFSELSLCDYFFPSEDIEIGEEIVSSDKKSSLKCISKTKTVVTPAGIFENCYHLVTKNLLVQNDFFLCPGIGLVKEISNAFTALLSSYKIVGGKGLVPFEKGNHWDYTLDSDSIFEGKAFHSAEVTYADGKDILLAVGNIEDNVSYRGNSWKSNMFDIGDKGIKLYKGEANFSKREFLSSIIRAEEFAKTKREKVHTAIAKKVIERICETNEKFNPEYKVKGLKEEFEVFRLYSQKTGTISLDQDFDYYIYYTEWFDGEFGRMVYTFPYFALNYLTGYLWSDEWVPGYRYETPNFDSETLRHRYVLEVFPDETVIVPSGIFENCRHIHIKAKNCAMGSLSCDQEYFFAPGVGLVKYVFNVGSIWELTKYEGTGVGFFPEGDRFFRRFDPKFLYEGYHAFVEYTYDQNEENTVIFRNASGTQDRANYEIRKRQKEEKMKNAK